MNASRYPDVRIALVGEDGNAFSILGRAMRAAREAGVPKEEIDAYLAEARSGDYDHLLRITMEWFDCAGRDEEEGDSCDECGCLLDEEGNCETCADRERGEG